LAGFLNLYGTVLLRCFVVRGRWRIHPNGVWRTVFSFDHSGRFLPPYFVPVMLRSLLRPELGAVALSALVAFVQGRLKSL
jgi:hypothetical protein